jgi:uncharacterized protein
MTWVVCDGRVVATAEIATQRPERRRGLLGRDDVDGAFVIERCRWVHTIGMRFPIDVAFVAADGTGTRSGVVTRTVCMPRHRIGRPELRATFVIEAVAGSFGRWGLHDGTHVEVVHV